MEGDRKGGGQRKREQDQGNERKRESALTDESMSEIKGRAA